jgi:cytochrome P450
MGLTLPAGPRRSLSATLRYLRDPFGTLLALADRHGDPFTWPTFLGRVIVTGDPLGIREILTADPDIYTALGAELLGPVLGADNPILLSGESHRAMRRFYGPQLHGERLRDCGAAIVRIAREHAARWPGDRPFAVEDTMRAISLEVILEVVLVLGEPAQL